MRTFKQTTFVALILAIAPLMGRADEIDPLSLQGTPLPAAPSSESQAKFFIEASVGQSARRYGLSSQAPVRVSVDYSQTFRLGDEWRGTLSDRLDYVEPVDAGQPRSVNSLREAFVSRRLAGGGAGVEIGRVNLRNGPAYGYNPTDFFRTGSIRSATSDDPMALRENRLGTVMLHYQLLQADGSASMVLAPKVSNSARSAGFSPDFGSTNNENRMLLSWSKKVSGSTSGQVLLYGVENKGAQVGLNMTSLLSNSAVLHAEWTRGRDAVAFELANVARPSLIVRNRAAVGATYTTPTRATVTVEYEYNGFAPSRTDWSTLAKNSADQLANYLGSAQRQQDNAARQSWLVYLTQRNAVVKNLDVSAFVRLNPDDHSRLTWLEMRYHWTNFDGALQWRTSTGGELTEFGIQPRRETLQLLGAWYF